MEREHIVDVAVDTALDPLALVLRYTVVTSQWDEEGELVGKSERAHTKRVKLKALATHTNIEKLAVSIVGKLPKVLREEHVPLVMDALGQLQAAMAAAEPSPGGAAEGKLTHEEEELLGPHHRAAAGLAPAPASATASGHTGAAIQQYAEGKHQGTSALRHEQPAPAPALAPRQPQRAAEARSPSSQEQVGDSPRGPAPASPRTQARWEAQREREAAMFGKKWASELASAGAARHAAEKSASGSRLEDYLEALYDTSLDAKLDGARRILALVREPSTLELVIGNETLLGAMARILREEYKVNKHAELTYVLLCVFFCTSHYSQLHPLIMSHRIGDVAMRVVELEAKRYAARASDLERLAALAEAQARGDAQAEADIRAEDEDIRAHAEHLISARRARARAKRESAAQGKHADSDDSSDEEASSSYAAGGSDWRAKRASILAQAAQRLMPLPEGRVDIVKERVKFRLRAARQERTLFVAYHLLLNLAEDPSVERKMGKRGVVQLLVPLLERPNPDLLMLAATFLRKLSLFEPNKNAMAAAGAVPRLLRLLPLPPQHDILGQACLELLFNLSFDPALRKRMIKAGLPALASNALGSPALRGCAMRLLYNLSRISTGRAVLAATPAVGTVVRVAKAFPESELPPELAGLLLNLAADGRGVQALLAAGAVHALTTRALQSGGDVLALRVLRAMAHATYTQACEAANAGPDKTWQEQRPAVAATDDIDSDDPDLQGVKAVRKRELAPRSSQRAAQHAAEINTAWRAARGVPWAGVWQDAVPKLLHVLPRAGPEVTMEMLGILARLTPADLPHGMTPRALLSAPGVQQAVLQALSGHPPQGDGDDGALQALLFVQAMAAEPCCAVPLAHSPLLAACGELLLEGARDPELVAQIAELVRRALHHEATRAMLFARGSPVGSLLSNLADFASHASEVAATAVDGALALAIELMADAGDPALRRRLQARRFTAYNREWLAAEAGHAGVAEWGTPDWPGSGAANDASATHGAGLAWSPGLHENIQLVATDDLSAYVAQVPSGATPPSMDHHMRRDARHEPLTRSATPSDSDADSLTGYPYGEGGSPSPGGAGYWDAAAGLREAAMAQGWQHTAGQPDEYGAY